MTKNFVIRIRKVETNKLLERKQFILDVASSDHTPVTKKDIATEVAKKWNVSLENVVIYGLQTKYGGGRTSGFGFVYNSKDSLMKFEPKLRKLRSGLIAKKAGIQSRRLKKETKNKLKKFRGKLKYDAAKKDKKKK